MLKLPLTLPLLAFWGLIMFPQIFVIATGRELWPYSSFPMFSLPRAQGQVIRYGIFAETRKDPSLRLSGLERLFPLSPPYVHRKIEDLHEWKKLQDWTPFLTWYAERNRDLDARSFFIARDLIQIESRQAPRLLAREILHRLELGPEFK